MSAPSTPAPKTLTRLTGWGGTAGTLSRLQRPNTAAAVAELVGGAEPVRGTIARGLGRSYGDAAQDAGGLVIDLTGLHRVHRVDTHAGTVTVDAGVSFEALIGLLLPFGLWVPVLPGTRKITVGGAIAADVHGKNHHTDGSFGTHVLSLDLITADGTSRTLAPTGPDVDLFEATVGGMGLTGVIVQATIACKKVQTSYVSVDTERAADLNDLMARLAAGDAHYPYSVAWFDATSTGRHLGRAVITRGRNANIDDLSVRQRDDPLGYRPSRRGTVPPHLPSGLLNRASAAAFNELWFRKAPRLRQNEVQDLASFFHPLDGVGRWNRLYGPAGFVQYQAVVPDGQELAVQRVVETFAHSGHVSCLNVLKRFGPGNRFPMSFPIRGWTLTVDIPVSRGLNRLLHHLDQIVLSAGGRLYLAKDSRTTAPTVAQMSPGLDRFKDTRARVDPDGLFTSDLSRRLAL